uniref:hypothetical protein n=1 Tax=Candidatus Entotheonella palauensis TaxID=93172 RepID=UPI001C4DE314
SNAINNDYWKRKNQRMLPEALWNHDVSRSILCMFVLEAIPAAATESLRDIKPIMQKGVHEGLWRNFSRIIRPKLQESGFLRNLLIEGKSLPLLLSNYILNYAGEFDFLALSDRKNTNQNKSYWISAITLRRVQIDGPDRILVVLYKNRGDEITPKLPSSANQQWRVLQFLGSAYQVLQHQLANVADEVRGQRQKLLLLLAPGILHHEMGIQMVNLRGFLDISSRIAERINHTNPADDASRLSKNLNNLRSLFDQIYNTTSTFSKEIDSSRHFAKIPVYETCRVESV